MQLRPYQKQLSDDIDAAWSSGARNVMAVAPTGAGKCLARGTPVMMYSGHLKPVELIQVGEQLMGPDSRPRTVLSLARGREMMYRVTPVKGDSYVVNESHILSLKRTAEYSGDKRMGNIVNLTVAEYVVKSKTWKHLHKGWRPDRIDFDSSSELPMPAYMVGVWLGDGSTGKPSITSGDVEIITAFRDYAESLGLTVRYENNSTKSIMVHAVGRPGKPSPFSDALRILGIFEDKKVPHCIKTGTRETRLEFLAGILDTDGHYDGRGYQFTQLSEQILDSVVFIARSLGLAAYKTQVQKTCTNNGYVGTYFTCNISGNLDIIPCRVERQKAKARGQKKNVLLTGITVESVGVDDYFGFEIDGDRLFLLGDFTVTHNTVLFAHKIKQNQGGYSAAIAHRQELVTQMALTMARNGIVHRIIAPRDVIQNAVKIQQMELGRNFYNSQANVACVAVNTLLARKHLQEVTNFTKRCNLLIVDEGHHVQENNMWGKALEQCFRPDARGMFPTATPQRADGGGLARGKGGLADTLVRGPEPRWLIDNGFLCDYRLISQPSNMNFSDAKTGADGDYSVQTRRRIAQDSNIVGCVAEHYIKYAMGKLGVTFAPDLKTGQEIANKFNELGVPALLVSGETPDLERFNAVRGLKSRKYLQLVNVDLFGEGFDLPAIEVVSMARKTESLAVFLQQFGRSLRSMEGKDRAIIIDHVNNWQRHGLPDKYRHWTLEPREKRSSNKKDPDEIPLRECQNDLCHMVYERIHPACPYCGHVPLPGHRGSPEMVDGVLAELDPTFLAAMRGEVAKLDGPCFVPNNVPKYAAGKVQAQHIEKQLAQLVLRETMAQWAGWQTQAGHDETTIQKLFYWRFGIDVLSAQALPRKEAEELARRIAQHAGKPEPEFQEKERTIDRIQRYLQDKGPTMVTSICADLNITKSTAQNAKDKVDFIESSSSGPRGTLWWLKGQSGGKIKVEDKIIEYLQKNGESSPKSVIENLNLGRANAINTVSKSNRIFSKGKGISTLWYLYDP